MSTDGYTEYGYRGLEEIKKLEEQIKKLKQELEELKEQIKESKH
tara:strand:- start:890 stop:1021 length:132 start_codon:yes stop_codon:yes gene_type:complete